MMDLNGLRFPRELQRGQCCPNTPSLNGVEAHCSKKRPKVGPDTQDVESNDPTVLCDPNLTPVKIALESHPRSAESESTFEQDPG